MREAEIIVPFQVFAYEELPADVRELVDMAKAMTATSYSPYSHFRVGAALRLADGQVFKGSNQENAAFPSGLCAERSAIFAAGAQYPDQPIVMLAIGLAIVGAKIQREQFKADSKSQQMTSNATKNMMIEMIGKTKAERKAIARKYGIH